MGRTELEFACRSCYNIGRSRGMLPEQVQNVP